MYIPEEVLESVGEWVLTLLAVVITAVSISAFILAIIGVRDNYLQRKKTRRMNLECKEQNQSLARSTLDDLRNKRLGYLGIQFQSLTAVFYNNDVCLAELGTNSTELTILYDAAKSFQLAKTDLRALRDGKFVGSFDGKIQSIRDNMSRAGEELKFREHLIAFYRHNWNKSVGRQKIQQLSKTVAQVVEARKDLEKFLDENNLPIGMLETHEEDRRSLRFAYILD